MPRRPVVRLNLTRSRETCIFLRFEEGISQKEVAWRMEVPICTLRRWEKIYRETGRMKNARMGRPKGAVTVLTPRNLRRIKRYHHGKQRRSIRKCVRHMKHKHGVVLSRSTVQQALVDHLGLYPYRLKRAPMLNSVRKARRLEVATQFLNSHKRNPWRYWAITDEKRFNSEPKPNSHNDVIWDDQPDDDKHYCPRSKYGGHSVEVWGCLTWFGKPPLIFIERPLMLRNGRQVKQPFRAPDYVAKILRPSMPKIKKIFNDHGVQDRQWSFQQDGDAKHTSNLVQHWLSDNVVNFVAKGEWPAGSPDLSIIENVWSIMDTELAHKKPCGGWQSRAEFKNAIKDVWKHKITEKLVHRLFRSIPNHMLQVQQRQGGNSGY